MKKTEVGLFILCSLPASAPPLQDYNCGQVACPLPSKGPVLPGLMPHLTPGALQWCRRLLPGPRHPFLIPSTPVTPHTQSPSLTSLY